MKKLLMLMAIFTLALTSCSKDDEPEITSLNGTTWSIEYNNSKEINNLKIDFKVYMGLIFAENSMENKMGVATIVDGKATPYQYETEKGTYSYNPPKVIMTIDGDTVEGKIAGNNMTVTIDGAPLILTKE